MAPSQLFQSNIDAHEERLLRLESTVQDAVANIGEMTVKQDFIGKQLAESTERIASQLEQGFNSMRAAQTSLSKRMDSYDEHIEAQTNRIEPLERAQQAADARMSNLRKLLWAGALAACGALGTKIFEVLLIKLS